MVVINHKSKEHNTKEGTFINEKHTQRMTSLRIPKHEPYIEGTIYFIITMHSKHNSELQTGIFEFLLHDHVNFVAHFRS